ncbi:ankyrin repeat domain-containing protein [Streptomyces sp. NBC_01381]|uniref:ankyrin repeat domain-containing protein n=1 Tax=Streptomyces sp. NBC_01381 TaxID=2903845 RepID=UPI002254166D|nr:ankyrin repeat domain-containing protein [Streptomyces sp. NBC_01381]MCX4669241.1 ankyrin repeat domain-containing protein [Streptomyces sp. NBC_01381]
MKNLNSLDPLAISATEAIRKGDVQALRRLLADHPGLASGTITTEGPAAGGRSLLHIAADWPGHYPQAPEVIAALAAAGADPSARFVGSHSETPLHWAASNDDVIALDALIAAGADIEATGAVIGGGTPLADARGFGQWRAARRLLEHGARADLQDAATLGLLDQVEAFITAAEPPTGPAITSAFWGACHGGQLPTAQRLFQQGADLDWIGYDDMTPLDIARAQDADDVVRWLLAQGASTRAELGNVEPE